MSQSARSNMAGYTDPPGMSVGMTGNDLRSVFDTFFGKPTNDYKLDYLAEESKEEWSLPEAIAGNNKTNFYQRIELLTLTTDNFYTQVLAPVVQLDQGSLTKAVTANLPNNESLHIEWDTITFEPTLASVVPPRGRTRLVSHQRDRQSGKLQRFGIGLEFEYGFMMTDYGRTVYMMGIEQLNTAVQEGMSFGVIHAYLTCEYWHKKNAMEIPEKAWKAERVEQFFDRERFFFGVMQKHNTPLEIVDTKITEDQFTLRGTGDTYLIHWKMACYLSQIPDYYINYSKGGQLAVNRLRDGVQNFTQFRGTRIYIVRGYDVNGLGMLDIFKETAIYGEWNLAFDHLKDGPVSGYTSACREIQLYDADRDSMPRLGLRYFIDNCGRWDKNTGELIQMDDPTYMRNNQQKFEPTDVIDSLHYTATSRQPDSSQQLKVCRYFGQIEQRFFPTKYLVRLAQTAVQSMANKECSDICDYGKTLEFARKAIEVMESYPYDFFTDVFLGAVARYNLAKNGDTERHPGRVGMPPLIDQEEWAPNDDGCLDLPPLNYFDQPVLVKIRDGNGKPILIRAKDDEGNPVIFGGAFGKQMEQFLNFPQTVVQSLDGSKFFVSQRKAAEVFDISGGGYPDGSLYIDPVSLIDGDYLSISISVKPSLLLKERFTLPPFFGSWAGFRTISNCYAGSGSPDAFHKKYGFNGEWAQRVHHSVVAIESLARGLERVFPLSEFLNANYTSSWFHRASPESTLFENLVTGIRAPVYLYRGPFSVFNDGTSFTVEGALAALGSNGEPRRFFGDDENRGKYDKIDNFEQDGQSSEFSRQSGAVVLPFKQLLSNVYSLGQSVRSVIQDKFTGRITAVVELIPILYSYVRTFASDKSDDAITKILSSSFKRIAADIKEKDPEVSINESVDNTTLNITRKVSSAIKSIVGGATGEKKIAAKLSVKKDETAGWGNTAVFDPNQSFKTHTTTNILENLKDPARFMTSNQLPEFSRHFWAKYYVANKDNFLEIETIGAKLLRYQEVSALDGIDASITKAISLLNRLLLNFTWELEGDITDILKNEKAVNALCEFEKTRAWIFSLFSFISNKVPKDNEASKNKIIAERILHLFNYLKAIHLDFEKDEWANKTANAIMTRLEGSLGVPNMEEYSVVKMGKDLWEFLSVNKMEGLFDRKPKEIQAALNEMTNRFNDVGGKVVDYVKSNKDKLFRGVEGAFPLGLGEPPTYADDFPVDDIYYSKGSTGVNENLARRGFRHNVANYLRAPLVISPRQFSTLYSYMENREGPVRRIPMAIPADPELPDQPISVAVHADLYEKLTGKKHQGSGVLRSGANEKIPGSLQDNKGRRTFDAKLLPSVHHIDRILGNSGGSRPSSGSRPISMNYNLLGVAQDIDPSFGRGASYPRHGLGSQVQRTPYIGPVFSGPSPYDYSQGMLTEENIETISRGITSRVNMDLSGQVHGSYSLNENVKLLHGQTNDLLILVIAMVYLFTRTNIRSVYALIENDVLVPFNFLVARPFIRFETYMILKVQAGKDTAQTFVARPVTSWGDNAQTQVYTLTLTYYSKTIVFNPKNIYIARHTFITGYLGGMGIMPYQRETYEQQDYQFKHNDSVFVILEPYTTTDYPNLLNLLGKHKYAMPNFIDNPSKNETPHYVNFQWANLYWNWFTTHSKFRQSEAIASYEDDEQQFNFYTHRGLTLYFNPVTNAFTYIRKPGGYFSEREIGPGCVQTWKNSLQSYKIQDYTRCTDI